MATQRISGRVQSGSGAGAIPRPYVTVTIYEVSGEGPRDRGSARADADGRFTVDVSIDSTPSILYANSYVETGVQLMTVIGPEIRPSIVINELTTVAAGFSMAQFAVGSVLAGTSRGLRIAAGMNDNLVSPVDGTPAEVMLRSPNADQTTSLRMLRMLGNLLAGCVRQVPGVPERVRELAPDPNGDPAVNTFRVVVNIALNPTRNVAGLYTLAQEMEIYLPRLEELPYAWALAVKVHDSGSPDYMFGGPANIAFDADGYAWVANNVIQGTPNSASCIMVLKPDGRPARGENGGPTSPVFGGGIFGVGFGIAVAPNRHVWVGNFGWGDPDTQYPEDGTVSELYRDGEPVSPSTGYGAGTDRVQGVAADAEGNIWLASFGNDALVVFPRGDSTRPVRYPDTIGTAGPVGTFGIAPAEPGTAWVTYSGGLGWPAEDQAPSHVCKFRLTSDGRLERTLDLEIGSVTKGVALDSRGNAWIASGGDDTVYMVSPDGSRVSAFTGGGISGPWSVAVDGNDDVWVANFGPMGPIHDFTSASITKLAGLRPPEGHQTGDVLSGEYGYPLWSAGEQVLLPDGTPLYGEKGPPCYNPLMRMTSVTIDQAGNIWAVNNWKPNFATDFDPCSGNPGGDGIVIFVGLAAPPPPRL